MDTPRTPDEPAPDKPPRPDEPAPAVVLVLGEKVADGAEDDLNRVVDDNLDLLGPLREFLLRNKVPRVARVVTALTRDELLEAEREAVADPDFAPLESLTRYWRIDVAGLDGVKSADQLVEELLAGERDRAASERGVVNAYVESAAESPGAPAVVGALTVQSGQGWLRPAEEGVNAWAAWDHHGGKGDGITVIDVEQGWQFTHPDVDGLAGTAPLVHRNRFDESPSEGDHGTSVLGIVVGRTNGVGGTGIAPHATVRTCSHYDGGTVMRTVDAILIARKNLDAGDVLLLEVHLPHMDYLCAEADDATFHAIRLAASKGIVVVEAAGNGAEDISQWKSAAGRRLSRDVPTEDSGAIVVGACWQEVETIDGTTGHGYNGAAGSNYGARVDCYAWGDGVEAPIVGTTASAHGPFGGTSAAAAIIAGVAAAVQGMVVAANQPRLRTKAMRTLLRDTAGTKQVPAASTFLIGVMPDLGHLATAVGARRI
ncbi:S8 family serine peptidase [Pseudonocardia saturnea]